MNARNRSVALGVGWRTIHTFLTNPQFLLPSLIFPLFFFTAFAGGLSNVSNVPGFDFPSGYTAFQFVFVTLQASAFGGVFTGFSIAADMESGFARRMMLAAPDRRAIIVGYWLAAFTRWVMTMALITGVALIVGMQIDGGASDMFGLYLTAFLLNMGTLLFACGVAMRLRTMQAGPAMQMPVFFSLFLAPVFVPLELLKGWIYTAAHLNPITPLLDFGRDLISGGDADPLALLVVGGLVTVMSVWAVTGLRNAERAGA